ncbi:MAG: beta-ketoacyl-[acyl-carrier-protein] synthase family protein [Candidatus Omnitrophica bacterium]|nr:beta-ketoacyl-[acyl-carrier-protein] synthase family protein [Candidatus Omnitrophota bacterium]
MKKRVVITGLGVLASNGQGKEEYWQALKEGRVGYKPVSLFETGSFFTNMAGEISDFDPKIYLGPKGLRTLDRSTKLLVSAAKMAIDDSKLIITEENTDDIGVSVGCTLGSLKSISDFDEVTLKEGPRYTNPAFFPNTVINSPASQVSIWHNIQGFNTTISTGFTASLDAMSYAYDFIKMDRVKVVLAGGVEELCPQTFWGFHQLGCLSGSKKGEEFINCPFDRRRNGVTFGEGACLIAMEDYDHACERGVEILGEVLGFGYYFDPYHVNAYNPKGIGVKAAIKNCLNDAGLEPREVDYICANANSSQAADKIETDAIKEIFGKQSYEIPVSAVKSMVGECYSVSGALAVAASLGGLTKGFLPPTVNLEEPDKQCDLDYVPNQARAQQVKTVLVINFGPNGSCACMILGSLKG